MYKLNITSVGVCMYFSMCVIIFSIDLNLLYRKYTNHYATSQAIPPIRSDPVVYVVKRVRVVVLYRCVYIFVSLYKETWVRPIRVSVNRFPTHITRRI